jgi:predicted peroxiredoxin
MSQYLLIQARDPFDFADVTEQYEMAAALARDGHKVTMFLVQNGVLPARPGPRSAPLAATAAAGVEILADEFSLRERGIPKDRLATGVKAAPLDVVVDQLAEGRKALWL